MAEIWTKREIEDLIRCYLEKPYWVSVRQFAIEYAARCGRTSAGVRAKILALQEEGLLPSCRITPSPYPVYDSPLIMEGDALILPDLELPFHHAEFVDKCLELAEVWGIRQCILAGDALHFDMLSGWEPNWKSDRSGGITEDVERKLWELAGRLREKDRRELAEILIGAGSRDEADGLSTELAVARRVLRELESRFDLIDYVLGNHEGRLLRALETALSPDELLRLLETDKRWRISTYYYSILISNGVKYQIEHPKTMSAKELAAKYHCHIIMAHSHRYSVTVDISGQYIAAEIGCCVDESRLPYASQRHNKSPAHVLGAAIVRNGYLWVINRFTDVEALKKIAS